MASSLGLFCAGICRPFRVGILVGHSTGKRCGQACNVQARTSDQLVAIVPVARQHMDVCFKICPLVAPEVKIPCVSYFTKQLELRPLFLS